MVRRYFYETYLKPSLEAILMEKRKIIIKKYSQILNKSTQTIASYLKELEDKKYIKSERDTVDKRGRLCRLNP